MENKMLLKKLLFVVLISLCVISCSKSDNNGLIDDKTDSNTEENTVLSMIQGKWVEDPTYCSIENFVDTYEPNGVIIQKVYNKRDITETYYATYVVKGNKLYVTDSEGTVIMTIKTLTTKQLVLLKDDEILTFTKQ